MIIQTFISKDGHTVKLACYSDGMTVWRCTCGKFKEYPDNSNLMDIWRDLDGHRFWED